MQFKIKTVLSFLFTFGICIAAIAADPPTAPADSEDISGHQTQEWFRLQTELGEKKGKIEIQNKIVGELLRKSKQEGAQMPPDQINELKESHKKLTKMTDDYNELLTKYEIRFPEKGMTKARKYFRIDNLTLEQLEARMTLESRQKNLLRKIRTQYNKPEGDDVTKKAFDPKKDKKPEVTEQIIFVK